MVKQTENEPVENANVEEGDENQADCTPSERRIGSTYLREFGLGAVGYSILAALVVIVVDYESAGWWKYLVALLPMAPALWVGTAVARHLRRIDEMQRTIQISGMAIGFGTSMIAAMTVGFLTMAGLQLSHVGPWIVFSAGMLGWAIGAGRTQCELDAT